MRSLFSIIILSFFYQTWSQEFQSSKLPIIVVNSSGNTIVDEPKVSATMGVINNGDGATNSINEEFNDYNGNIAIELRGSSSQFYFDKKGYGLELRDESNMDLNASILGMPEEEDWVLHGPYSDKTLMRNLLTFHLWEQTGRYGSRTQLVELVLNEEYQGVYLLMEKIKRDKNRVDISKLTEEENSGDDLTGGYIVKLDKSDGTNSGSGWVSPYDPPGAQANQDVFFQFHYPKGDEISSEQAVYIEDFLTDFEDALWSPSFKDPLSGYRKYIDPSSFIDFMIINEISKNVDGYRLSTFMYKTKESDGGLLNMGPIWDFNLAFGNANYCEGGSSSGWAWDFNDHCPEDFWVINFWWERLLKDPTFAKNFKSRWSSLRSGSYATDVIMAYIDSAASALEEPAARNLERWPGMSEWVWPNNFVGDDYQAEIDYLKNWTMDRLDWLDNNIARLDDTEIVLGIADVGHTEVFPNPVRNDLMVFSDYLIRSIEVFDASGKSLQKENVQLKRYVFDARPLKRGTYFLKVDLGGFDSELKRIIKQ